MNFKENIKINASIFMAVALFTCSAAKAENVTLLIQNIKTCIPENTKTGIWFWEDTFKLFFRADKRSSAITIKKHWGHAHFTPSGYVLESSDTLSIKPGDCSGENIDFKAELTNDQDAVEVVLYLPGAMIEHRLTKSYILIGYEKYFKDVESCPKYAYCLNVEDLPREATITAPFANATLKISAVK